MEKYRWYLHDENGHGLGTFEQSARVLGRLLSKLAASARSSGVIGFLSRRMVLGRG